MKPRSVPMNSVTCPPSTRSGATGRSHRSPLSASCSTAKPRALRITRRMRSPASAMRVTPVAEASATSSAWSTASRICIAGAGAARPPDTTSAASANTVRTAHAEFPLAPVRAAFVGAGATVQRRVSCAAKAALAAGPPARVRVMSPPVPRSARARSARRRPGRRGGSAGSGARPPRARSRSRARPRSRR